MSAKLAETYARAFQNVRSGRRSNIIEGINLLQYLREKSESEPLASAEIDFNLALAFYRLSERNKFNEIATKSKDVRVAQLVEIESQSREVEETETLKAKQLKSAVQQVSLVLISASLLTFLSYL